MDKFEKILRDKLQHHEANMPAGEWEKFSQRLDQVTPKPNPWKSYLAGGLAAATIGVGAYFLMPSGNKPAVQKHTAVEHNITVKESNKANQITGGQPSVNTNGQNNENVTGHEISPAANKTATVYPSGNHVVTVNPTGNNKSNERKQGNTVTNTNERNSEKNTNTNTNTASNTPVNNVAATITLPEPEISGTREICQNAEVVFKAANHRNDHDIAWLLNGEEVSSEAELRISFSKPGTQTLQLVYGTVQGGKRVTTASEKRFINILPAPTADIDVNKVNDYSADYLFKAPVVEGNEYVWNFGDGKVQTGNELTHAYRKKGEYNVTLSITGSNGCKARTSDRVEIEKDYNLLTPNAFSPNNDGHNDVFISEALKAMPDVRFRMQIFDKSGKKIFETTRIDNPWDGRNTNNGAMCAPDAYVWRVELTKPDGTKEEYMGSVTLLPN